MSMTSCFGMAGHLAAMSEFLLRGYNVAIPYVDRGDDILTIEDSDSLIRRIQVKTSSVALRGTTLHLKYKLKTLQLRTPDRETQLFYMFMWRDGDRWRWILLSRGQLNELREAESRGRPRESSTELTLEILLEDSLTSSPVLWGSSLAPYYNRWSADSPVLPRTLMDETRAEDPPTPRP